jgi:hypothetical protein
MEKYILAGIRGYRAVGRVSAQTNARKWPNSRE